MDAYKLREMTEGEILAKMDEAYQELFNLRFQLSIGQLKNPNRAKEVKKDIARMKTVLRERELAALETGAE